MNLETLSRSVYIKRIFMIIGDDLINDIFSWQNGNIGWGWMQQLHKKGIQPIKAAAIIMRAYNIHLKPKMV